MPVSDAAVPREATSGRESGTAPGGESGAGPARGAPKALPHWAEFGRLLRHLRRRAGLTQSQLGLRVGYHHSLISKWESGLRELPAPLVARLDTVLGTGGELGAAEARLRAAGGPPRPLTAVVPAPARPLAPSDAADTRHPARLSVRQPDEPGRTEPPLAAGEAATLLGFLDHQRATLARACEGLDAAGLRTTAAGSALTLGGMLKHLARVEDQWCSQWLHGRAPQPPWDTVDWAADPAWDWHSAADDTPEQLRTLWRESVARSRRLVAEALSRGGPDRLAVRARPDGSSPSLRWILCRLIEEYARHNGHADLIRVSVDRRTGP